MWPVAESADLALGWVQFEGCLSYVGVAQTDIQAHPVERLHQGSGASGLGLCWQVGGSWVVRGAVLTGSSVQVRGEGTKAHLPQAVS